MDVTTGQLHWVVPAMMGRDQIIQLFFSYYLGVVYATWLLMFLKFSAPFRRTLYVLKRAWFSPDWGTCYWVWECIVFFYWSQMVDSPLPPWVQEPCEVRMCVKKCPKNERATLTSLVLRVRMRSRSSTSCLKVGLWDEMACQQSFIIMYLTATKSQCVYSKRRVHSGGQNRVVKGIVISFT